MASETYDDIGIAMYDQALSTKIKSWLPAETDVEILTQENLTRRFEIAADKSNDSKISFPRVDISRDRTFELQQSSKNEMSFNGVRLYGDDKEAKILNSIPISLDYQIDIYAKKAKEADAILVQLLFKLINNPRIVVTLSDGKEKIPQVFHFYLDPQIENSSDVQERLYQGEFTRWTIKLHMPNVRLYQFKVAKNIRITAEVEIDEQIKEVK